MTSGLEHPLHDRAFTLNGGRRRHRVPSADLVFGGLRLSPATDLALRDQLAHHDRNFFDGDGRRYSVRPPTPQSDPISLVLMTGSTNQARRGACEIADTDLVLIQIALNGVVAR